LSPPSRRDSYQRASEETGAIHTYREEVLDQHLFVRLEDVREATWQFLIDYNEHRPHDSLGGMTPIEYRHHRARSSTFGMSA
jgi:putative transposase